MNLFNIKNIRNIFDRIDYKAFDENVFENNDKLMYNKSLMIKEICEYFK